MWLFRR